MLFKRVITRHGLCVRKGFLWLLAVLFFVSLWSAWVYFRPYDANAPGDASWKVLSASVKRDKSYYWVRSHFRVMADVPLPQSILLVSKNRKIRSADCIRENQVDHISFWVEAVDLQGECRVELNGVSFLLKKEGEFSLEDQQEKVFRSTEWK